MAKKKDSSLGLASFMDQSEIHGFPVKEWTTQQFCQLYPDLKTVVDKLVDAGATLESFETGFLQNHLPTLPDALIPIMPNVIRVSCPDKTDQECNDLAWGPAVQLTMAIMKKNMEHVADFFGLNPV